MDWAVILIVFVGMLIVLMMAGIPVAFAFLITNFTCLFLFADGLQSLFTVVPSGLSTMISITMLAVPLFILMGEIIFHSGVGLTVMDAMDLWIGRVPGRLSLLAVGGGTIFAMLSGSSIATTAMLGSVLLPGMRQKNYSVGMCVGPILAGGTLATIIPPTVMAVILATLAGISISKLLMALFVPGFLLAFAFCLYIVIRAILRPEQSPPYHAGEIPLKKRAKSFLHIVPLACVIFLVTGVIFVGIATPTEAAALGAFGSFLLAAGYKKLDGPVFKKILIQTGTITCAVFTIIIGSSAFSRLLAYTGAGKALVAAAVDLPLPPIALIIMMQIVLFILGTFMDQFSIMMITIPLVAPIVTSMGFDLIWFSTVTLINLSFGGLTPPFGLNLFAMKGVVPPDIGMWEIIRAAFPYMVMGMIGSFFVLAFPSIALWLPRVSG